MPMSDIGGLSFGFILSSFGAFQQNISAGGWCPEPVIPGVREARTRRIHNPRSAILRSNRASFPSEFEGVRLSTPTFAGDIRA